ncbi:hypothetical protein [Pedobacter punctiformis]|uniref:Uncharacterized protein n=1 Tax=Pedobacter punctiformis TaxID=3004097 RepID=A0ABT4L897_9SPHI|nr:hypothetical protein [Pedobacter sp. HCMS5-2]MCZ4244120.1 hypothetical protein [Pedobacter sp. HCMS5-2]
MKRLTVKLVLPLTIISFVVITKWWLVKIVDAPDETLTGFPLPFVCRAWNTSMAFQFFIAAFMVDFLFYFLCWFGLIFVTNRYLISIKPYKIVTVIWWCLAALVIFGADVLALNKNNIFYFKRPFEIETIASGVSLLGNKL